MSAVLRAFNCLACLFLILWVPPAGAAPQLSLDLGRVEAGPLVADGASAVLLLRDGGRADLRFFAADLRLPAARLQRLDIHCADALLQDGRIHCEKATFNADHGQHGPISGEFSFDYERGTGLLHGALAPLQLGQSVIEGTFNYSPAGWQAEMAGKDLSVPVLRALLDGLHLWPPGYEDESGRLDVALRVAAEQGALTRLEGVVRARGVNFYGRNSAEDLSLDTTFEVDLKDRWAAKLNGTLQGGALFVELGGGTGTLQPGIVLEAGPEPLEFGGELTWEPGQKQLDLKRFRLNHPGVGDIVARGRAARQERWHVESAHIELTGAEAGPAYETYLQPFLVGTAFSALEVAGRLEAIIGIENDGLKDLDLRIEDVHVYDDEGRFAMAGLGGDLHVTSGERAVQSSLQWDGMQVYRLQFGGGALALSSQSGGIEVKSWRDVPFLDGMLHIESLRAVNAGRADMSVTLSGELTPVSMADLTQQLGWPVMSGTLGGRIEGLRWQPGQLVVDGDFLVHLFDGEVAIRNLRVDDLFGLVPQLYADIGIRNMDLARLTDRFSFGKIEGRLEGRIAHLELEAWQPVYFEAELATPADDDSRHRISQRAVDNLGFIGGGASGALSGGFLRYFEDYSYGRLGISCRLANGVCYLGGVENSEDGFLIVSRGGLLPPWIEVRGNGRSIYWTRLLEALRSVTSNRPEIR